MPYHLWLETLPNDSHFDNESTEGEIEPPGSQVFRQTDTGTTVPSISTISSSTHYSGPVFQVNLIAMMKLHTYTCIQIYIEKLPYISHPQSTDNSMNLSLGVVWYSIVLWSRVNCRFDITQCCLSATRSRAAQQQKQSTTKSSQQPKAVTSREGLCFFKWSGARTPRA